jgi:hypothetical protein
VTSASPRVCAPLSGLPTRICFGARHNRVQRVESQRSISLTLSPGQKSGSIKLAKKDAKEVKPAAAKKAEPKVEKKTAAPKAKKATTVGWTRNLACCCPFWVNSVS